MEKRAGACPPRLKFLVGHRFRLDAARQKDLELLPGIGKILSKRIVSAKEKNEGRLDWKTVPGLNESVRQSLERWVYQENP